MRLFSGRIGDHGCLWEATRLGSEVSETMDFQGHALRYLILNIIPYNNSSDVLDIIHELIISSSMSWILYIIVHC